MESSDADSELEADESIEDWSPSTFLPPFSNPKEGPLYDWRAELDQWQQGHIVGPYPATWLTPVGIDDITGQSTAATETKPFYSPKVSGWFILVSQTCDIGATDTGGKQPFALVAPLRPPTAYSSSNRRLANAYQIPYLFPTLSPDEDKKDETWFADLRLMVPISKALLLKGKPIRGLRENDALKFAATIAHKFSRPALQDVLAVALPESIDKHILETKRRSSAYTQTEHVRLVVTLDQRLEAESVYLMVLGKVALTQDEQAQWRLWEPKGQAVLTPHGIELGPILFTTPETCPASLYRAAAPLRIDNLTNVHWL